MTQEEMDYGLPYMVRCPECLADRGAACIKTLANGELRNWPHIARGELANKIFPVTRRQPMTDPAQSEVIALRAQVAELTRDRDHQKERNESHLRLLERYASIEGKEHLQTIDERDSAEQALSQAYYLIKGESPQWSNLFGYEQALEDIDDAQKCFRAENAELRAELVTLKGVNEVLMRERNFDPGAGNVLAGFIEHRGRIQVDNDRLRAEVERLSWKPITPDSLPKWGDEVGCLDMTAWNVHSVAYIFNPTMRTLSGWTHYRPINPPASTKGEDNAETK